MANEPMATEFPNISRSRDRSCASRRDIVIRVVWLTRRSRARISDHDINLSSRKTGQVEIIIDFYQGFQFNGERISVPTGIQSEFVVSENIGSLVLFREMGEREARNIADTE